MDDKLLHWSKNGEMILKNRVKEAILRENAFEERSLDTTLDNLNKHRTQEERHLMNKQLQFASIKRKTLEKNLQTKSLEPLGPRSRQRRWSDSDVESGRLNKFKDSDYRNEKQFDAKLKWEKAISAVQLTVQAKAEKHETKQIKKRTANFLPPLVNTRRDHNRRRSVSYDNNGFTLPIIDEGNTLNCLKDPRFLKLQEVLSQRGENSEKRGVTQAASALIRFRSNTYH